MKVRYNTTQHLKQGARNAVQSVFLTLLLTILLITGSATLVLASDVSNAIWRGAITVSNNGTTASAVSTNMSLNTETLISNGYVADDLSDTAIQVNGVDTVFMPGANATYPWSIFVPSIGAGQNLNYDLYTGNVTGGKIRYFPGDAGMTSSDNADMELGDNFEVEQAGWISGESGYLVGKIDAFAITTIDENFYAYTEVDPNGKLTVNGLKVTAEGADRDENVYLYNDKGVNHFDALDIDFEIYQAATSLGDSRGGMAVSNTVATTAGFAATDISVHARKDGAGTYWLTLIRGADVAVDSYAATADTLYYCTLSRQAGNDSVNVLIYSDADRETLLDTLTVAGYGATKWRYLYGFVNNNNAVGAKDFDGYVQNINLNDGSIDITAGFPGTSVTASGLSSGEHTVKARQTTNLLTNGDFENGNPPDDWTAIRATAARDGTTVRINSYSANITCNDAGGAGASYYRQAVGSSGQFAGNEVTLSVFARAPPGNDKSQAIRIYDDSGGQSSATIAIDDEWHLTTVSYTAQSGQLYALFYVKTESAADTDDVLYVDNAQLIVGSDFSSFEGNLLSNWSFENGDPPNDWNIAGAGATRGQSTTQTKIGTYSANLTRNGADCLLEQQPLSPTTFQSQTLTMGCWVYASVPNSVRLRLSDDAVGATYSNYHTGDSTWQWITVSHSVGATATAIKVRLNVENTNTTAYFDGAVLIVGSSSDLETTRRIENLQLLVNDTLMDCSGNATVPDNSNDWYYVTNGAMPYMEYTKITVDDTLQQHIEWEYTEGDFTDLSGNSHDATPSYRTTSSDPDVSATLSSLLPVEEAKLDTFTLQSSYSILTENATLPSDTYDELDVSKIPGGAAVNEMLTEGDIPQAAWWFPFLFLGICVVGLIVYGATTLGRTGMGDRLREGQIDGSLLTMFVVMELALAVFGIIGVIPKWPMLLFPIPGIALILSRKHYSWG